MTAASLPRPGRTPRIRSQRPRRFRVPLDRRIVLTRSDASVLRYLVYLGFASVHALYLFGWLFRREGSKRRAQGLSGFARRLTTLFHEGLVFRVDPRFSRYVRGGASFLYCIESGRAAELARTGLHIHLLEPPEVESQAEAAAPLRGQLAELLVELGFERRFAEARLDATARSACKYLSGVTSLVPHTLLASSWLSIVWFGLLTAGRTLDCILPDSAADLSFWSCGSGLCSEHGHAAVCRAEKKDAEAHRAAWVPIQPDCLFVTGRTVVSLEAETGQSPRAKLAEKIDRYLALAASHSRAEIGERLGIDGVTTFVCVFHCATGGYAARVADLIAERCPAGTRLLRITTAQDFSLERTPSGRVLTRADFLRNAVIDGEPLYASFAGRALAPLFAEVQGTLDGEADVILRSIPW
jgi:hypothetical protein